jgi:hypothetical protein
MKRASIVLVLILLAAGGLFAETPQQVSTDANALLGQQKDLSADNHLFMQTSVIVSQENRIKLNDYRTKFNAISGRIYKMKNQISVNLNVREPNVIMLATLRTQLQAMIDEHDKLVTDFQQWVSSIPQQ